MRHRLIALITLAALFGSAGANASVPFPTLQETHPGLPLQTLAELGRSQLVITRFPARTYLHPDLPEQPIQPVQAFTLIRAPAAQVRRHLLDFERYPQIMPQVLAAKGHAREDGGHNAELVLSFRMPLFHLKPDIALTYMAEGKQALIERRSGGAIRYSLGRWEILPVDDRHTLLAHTAWTDPGTGSWILRRIFAIQPDFRRLSPVSASALTLQALRQDLEPRYLFQQRRVPSQPIQGQPSPALLPHFSDQQLAHLGELARQGDLTLVAPMQHSFFANRWYHHQAITSVTRAHGQWQDLQPYYSDLSRYPDYFDAIARIDDLDRQGLYLNSHWQLRFNFSLFRLGVNFAMQGEWQPDQRQFDFFSPEGDFDFLLGRWRWQQLDDGDTLALLSTAHDIDDQAPFLLRALADIPFNQMFSGIFIGSLLIEGQQQLLNQASAP